MLAYPNSQLTKPGSTRDRSTELVVAFWQGDDSSVDPIILEKSLASPN